MHNMIDNFQTDPCFFFFKYWCSDFINADDEEKKETMM